MSGAFRKMEVTLGATRYVLNREASEMLLAKLDEFGQEASAACLRLREDLRAALGHGRPLVETLCGPEVVEEVRADLNVEIARTEDGGRPAPDGTARCWFCGEAVSPAPGLEGLYVCANAACGGGKRPATRDHYEGGDAV